MSSEFFQHYGEPVSLFLKTMHLVYLALLDSAMAHDWEALNAMVDSAGGAGDMTRMAWPATARS